jgi:ubiquinone/menaquinone biosynthesis C-methylase UbiE
VKDAADAQERLRAFRARNLEYLRLGYDRAASARFVAGAAGTLRGPALDVGTGKGLMAMELARRGLPVVSVDTDDGERELAGLIAGEAGLAGRIAFVHADAACLPYPDGHFGCAASMDVLHHLDAPGPVLREMARVVGAGGVIVVADFDEDGFDLVARAHCAEGRVHPRAPFSVDAARRELEGAGCRCLARRAGFLHETAVLVRERTRE